MVAVTVPFPNDSTVDEVAPNVVGVLDAGDHAVLLTGVRRMGRVRHLVDTVEAQHPGSVMVATRHGNRVRVFAWPASADPDRSVWFYEP